MADKGHIDFSILSPSVNVLRTVSTIYGNLTRLIFIHCKNVHSWSVNVVCITKCRYDLYDVCGNTKNEPNISSSRHIRANISLRFNSSSSMSRFSPFMSLPSPTISCHITVLYIVVLLYSLVMLLLSLVMSIEFSLNGDAFCRILQSHKKTKKIQKQSGIPPVGIEPRTSDFNAPVATVWAQSLNAGSLRPLDPSHALLILVFGEIFGINRFQRSCHCHYLSCHSAVLPYHCTLLSCHCPLLSCHSTLLSCHCPLLSCHSTLLWHHCFLLPCLCPLLWCYVTAVSCHVTIVLCCHVIVFCCHVVVFCCLLLHAFRISWSAL